MSQTREHHSCSSREKQSEARFIGEAYDLNEDRVVIASSFLNDIEAKINPGGRSEDLDELTDRVDIVLFVPEEKANTGSIPDFSDEIEIKTCGEIHRRIVVRHDQIYIEQGALDPSRSTVVRTISTRVCEHEATDLVGFTRRVIRWVNSLES